MRKRNNTIFIIYIIITVITSCYSIKSTAENKSKPLQLTGVVEKTTEKKGTLSEYSYYFIKASFSSENNILFNKNTNDSRGFDEYIGKKVKITGKETIGFVGWRKEAKQGILVEKIEIIE